MRQLVKSEKAAVGFKIKNEIDFAQTAKSRLHISTS